MKIPLENLYSKTPTQHGRGLNTFYKPNRARENINAERESLCPKIDWINTILFCLTPDTIYLMIFG